MFVPYPLDDPALTLSEVLEATASRNPEHIYAHLVDGDTTRSISWTNYMQHARSVAARLKDLVSVAPSKDGPPAVALLANSDYVYGLNTIAIILNGWIVRNRTSLSLQMLTTGLHRLCLCHCE